MTGKDIIVVGLQPWDIQIGSNCKNIALELSKTNRVLYVNRALDRITYIRAKKDTMVRRRMDSIKGIKKDINLIQDNLYVLDPRVVLESINWIKSPKIFDYLNFHNNRRMARVIKDAARRIGFNKPVIFIDNDFIRYRYISKLYNHHESLIYYIRDYLLAHPYFATHGKRLEPGLIKTCNMVAANSAYLADYAREFNKKSIDIGQGCELENFLRPVSEIPADIRQIKEPIIGYAGALVSYRLDIKLIYQLATRNPQWNFVLVGPEDESFQKSELHGLTNVFFTGPKPPSELPSYINAFQVCINPQLLTALTIGNYPRKIDEYLAMGKPVVATDTPAMKMFDKYVYLTTDVLSYENAINLAISELDDNLVEHRRNFALSHTWSNSVNALYKAYEAK